MNNPYPCFAVSARAQFPPLPTSNAKRSFWHLPPGSSDAAAVATLAADHPGITLVLTEQADAAARLTREVPLFLDTAAVTLLSLPEFELLPYDFFSPHPDIISARLRTLRLLPERQHALLILPVSSMMRRLPPRNYLLGNSFSLAVAEHCDPGSFTTRLVDAGYQRVELVQMPGEFALRGGLIDLFPNGQSLPVRIELDDNSISRLQHFDPETQIRKAELQRFETLPARDVPLDPSAREHFGIRWRQRFDRAAECPLYRDIASGAIPVGIELYMPLFFDQTETLRDYLPDDLLLLEHGEVGARAEQYWAEIRERHQRYSGDRLRPLLQPLELFQPPGELIEARRGARTIRFNDKPNARRLQAFSALGVVPNTPDPPNTVVRLQALRGGRELPMLVCVSSEGRRELMLERLAACGLHPELLTSIDHFLHRDVALGICVCPLERGFAWMSRNRLLVCETDLLDSLPVSQHMRRSQSQGQLLESLTELIVDAPVVHRDLGVGRFRGLQAMEVNGVAGEFLVLDYASSDKLYLPATSLHLLSRYSGTSTSAPLHRLGSKQWESKRRKAAKRAHDIAANLLALYAGRQTASAKPLRPSAETESFALHCPFELTPDQQRCAAEIADDMGRSHPMDRLVCGDVGFGKTELAMRAAFTAVENGQQVAVLVPTTLLAQQHLESFRDRFANWPVNIEMISRLRTQAERESILRRLCHGQLDILIGTHALLAHAGTIAKLGLLIVDEEHRFGVRHKERLRELHNQVHLLTLTATPIPRTLNMALSAIRDISIISTPPPGRLSVRTLVREWHEELVREAIMRELLRGGQVYFVHNEVRSIEIAADLIVGLVPQARVKTAHGQMNKRELERVMQDFYRGHTNVLVCSSIIETGLDIPNANTILIERADRFGLAQLHQLRGRVGRSYHQAYAYLLLPPDGMTEDARLRIRAIESATELGSGFMLASEDLDIRGTGALLGDTQSGHVEDVGVSLFTEMISDAARAIRSGSIPNLCPVAVEIDLGLATLIPQDYLPDAQLRLKLYRRIAAASEPVALESIMEEMIDRFGTLPENARHLFTVAKLRMRAQKIGIARLSLDNAGASAVFSEHTKLQAERLVALVQRESSRYALQPNRLRVSAELEDAGSRSAFAESFIEELEQCV